MSGWQQAVADAPPVHRRRRRRPWALLLLVVLLAAALAVTGLLAAYLWRTTEAWRADAARLEAMTAELAGQRADLAAEVDQLRRDLAAGDEQLRRAQDRVSALAEEKARTADERESARLLAATAARVATQLETCVRGQDQLITALGDLESYDPQSVIDYAQTVQEACTRAVEGNAEIQRLLGDG